MQKNTYDLFPYIYNIYQTIYIYIYTCMSSFQVTPNRHIHLFAVSIKGKPCYDHNETRNARPHQKPRAAHSASEGPKGSPRRSRGLKWAEGRGRGYLEPCSHFWGIARHCKYQHRCLFVNNCSLPCWSLSFGLKC